MVGARALHTDHHAGKKQHKHGVTPDVPLPVVKHDVVVVGGGTAGLSVSHQLRRAIKNLDVAIVEPSSKHYYQPGWTMVGGGIFNKRDTQR